MNYVPIFICGKPKNSKTLSFELLSLSLYRENSKDNLFKKVLDLNIVYLFNKHSQVKKLKMLLKVFKNEIGLAEIRIIIL